MHSIDWIRFNICVQAACSHSASQLQREVEELRKSSSELMRVKALCENLEQVGGQGQCSDSAGHGLLRTCLCGSFSQSICLSEIVGVQDVESLKTSLESSERLRKQQKELIHLLQASHAKGDPPTPRDLSLPLSASAASSITSSTKW